MTFLEIFFWNLRIQLRSHRIYNTLFSNSFGLGLLILMLFSEIEQLSILNLYLITFVLGGIWSLNITAMNLIGMQSLMWPIHASIPNNLGSFFCHQSLVHGFLVALLQAPLMLYFLSRDELNESQKSMMISIFFLSLPLKIVQSLYVTIYRNFYQDKLFSSQFVPPSFAPVLVLVTDALVLLGCFLGINYYKEAKATVIFSVIFGVIVICFFISNLNIKLAARLLYKRRFMIYKNIQKRD